MGRDATRRVANTATESQNHRIVGVGRDHCGSSIPTLLLKQGHLQQAAQDLVQAGLEYLQRRSTGIAKDKLLGGGEGDFGVEGK